MCTRPFFFLPHAKRARPPTWEKEGLGTRLCLQVHVVGVLNPEGDQESGVHGGVEPMHFIIITSYTHVTIILFSRPRVSNIHYYQSFELVCFG